MVRKHRGIRREYIGGHETYILGGPSRILIIIPPPRNRYAANAKVKPTGDSGDNEAFYYRGSTFLPEDF